MMGVLHLLLLLLVPCSLHTDTSCEAEVGAKIGAKEGCGCAGSRQHGDTVAGGQEAASSSSSKYSAAANTESGDTGPRTNTMEPVPGATFTMGTDKPVFAADR